MQWETKQARGRYEKVIIAKMGTGGNDFALVAWMKAWKFRVCSVEIYRHDKSSSDLNITSLRNETPTFLPR